MPCASSGEVSAASQVRYVLKCIAPVKRTLRPLHNCQTSHCEVSTTPCLMLLGERCWQPSGPPCPECYSSRQAGNGTPAVAPGCAQYGKHRFVLYSREKCWQPLRCHLSKFYSSCQEGNGTSPTRQTVHNEATLLRALCV